MREKSKLEKYLDLYYRMFKKNYPLVIVGLSDEEHIERIKKCIETETEAEEPDYNDDCLY